MIVIVLNAPTCYLNTNMEDITFDIKKKSNGGRALGDLGGRTLAPNAVDLLTSPISANTKSNLFGGIPLSVDIWALARGLAVPKTPSVDYK